MSSTQISLQNVGKRYNHEWIFRSINHTFKQDEHTVILGANGSGKSTLLQVILGSTVSSEGDLVYRVNGVDQSVEQLRGMFSIATPYIELVEEYTLIELLEFHQKLMPFHAGLTIDSIVNKLYLNEARNKQLKYYSSGMKQRVKLGLALLSDTPFVLLDEPTSNLDAQAIEWYKSLVEENKKGRIIIVCSNDQQDEFSFCKSRLDVMSYK